MSFTIITDSCADLPVELIKKTGIIVMPMSVTIDNRTYKIFPDERELSLKNFYDELRNKKVATTSQINTAEFIQFAKPILAKGEDVLVISFSSALSGTFNSIRLGCIELQQSFPERKIFPIDSLSASLGQGLLVHFAQSFKEQGLSIEETNQKIINLIPRLTHLFTVDDLGTLKRGGRLSATASFIGTLFQLKPILHVSSEGKLVPIGKVRGRKASLRRLVELVDEKIDEYDTLFISHGDDLESAVKVREMILLNHPHIKEIIMNPIGPTIGAHSGPNTVAVFFIGKER